MESAAPGQGLKALALRQGLDQAEEMLDAALAALSRQRWPAIQLGHFDPFLTVYRVLTGETGLLESNCVLPRTTLGAAEMVPTVPKGTSPARAINPTRTLPETAMNTITPRTAVPTHAAPRLFTTALSSDPTETPAVLP
ncbi:hypothetical protein ABZR71_10110 [Pseudomonas paraeruginosa]|uniref:hypothetical protein n=1 Tax=Pseudomonas aeruginosa group TaxID=136841 RepID=UPI0011B280D2|nr:MULTISPECIES: hypothetical protein [Pseudomonas aeruginosa group]